MFGWAATAVTAGSSLALPVAGWLLDRAGAAAAAGGAAVLATAATLLALAVPAPRPAGEAQPAGRDVRAVTAEGKEAVGSGLVGEDRDT